MYVQRRKTPGCEAGMEGTLAECDDVIVRPVVIELASSTKHADSVITESTTSFAYTWHVLHFATL
jgi:hypothetical protein